MIKENKFNELKIGAKASTVRKITEKDITDFAKISGDFNPVHTHEEYSKNSMFKGKIVHGVFILSLGSAILGTTLPGPGYIYYSLDAKFLNPVFPGDTIKTELKLIEKNFEKRTLKFELVYSNQKNEVVIEQIAFAKTPKHLMK